MSVDSHGICYFLLGDKHKARAVVSLYSLRKFYDGPITILFSGADVSAISREFGAESREVPIRSLRRHTAYCAKSALWREVRNDVTLLVDADTVFFSDPSPLIDTVEDFGLTLTHFSDWVTTGPLMSGRIRKWQGIKCDSIPVDDLVEANLSAPFPALNTGIVGFSKDAQAFLEEWERLTYAGRHLNLTDELAAQLLARRHMHILAPPEWNWSPLHAKHLKPKIAHFHGNKAARPEAQPYFMPSFREVWNENKAGIQSWIPADDKQKYLEYL